MQLANEFGQSLEFKTLSSTQTAGVARGRLQSTELLMRSGYLLGLVAHFVFCECKPNSTESRSGHGNGTSGFAHLRHHEVITLVNMFLKLESVRVDGKGSGLVGRTG